MDRKNRLPRIQYLAFLLILLVTACTPGEVLGVPVGDGPMAGKWVGSIEDTLLGTGEIVLNTSQEICAWGMYCGWNTYFQTATYAIDFPTISYSGKASGSWGGESMTLTLHTICRNDDDSFISIGSTNGTSTISTRYDNVTCFGDFPSSGRIQLRK